MSDSGLRIRVDDDLKQAFIDACRSHDQTAAQVIRSFMRVYVDGLINMRQQDLFNGYSSSVLPEVEKNNKHTE